LSRVADYQLEVPLLGPVHTTLEEIENGVFALKTHQIFSIHTTPEKFEMQQSPVILDLSLRKTCAAKSRDHRDVMVFEKLRFQNVFPSTRKLKAGVFKFLRFEERFRKALFS